MNRDTDKRKKLDRRLDRKLRGVWVLQRMRTHIGGAMQTVTGATSAFLLLFLIDLAFEFPLRIRMILLGVALCFLLALIIGRWLIRLRRFEPIRAAVTVEAEHPEFHNLILSYVELSGGGHEGILGSQELKGVVRGQASVATQDVDFGKVVDFKTLKPELAVALAVLALVVGFCSVKAEHTRMFLLRMTGDNSPYPTKTRLDFVTGGQTLKQGDSLSLSARASGIVPQTAILHIRRPGRDWQEMELSRSEAHTFTHAFASLSSSFSYYYTIGDTQSDVFPVRVVPPPGVLEIKIMVRPPAYTRVPPYEHDNFNIEMPEGSEIEWRIVLDTELAGAVRILGTTNRADMTLSDDGRTVMGKLSLRESTAYHFVLRRRDFGFSYETALHRIFCKQDRVPQVTVVEPEGAVKATVNKGLTIRFQAKDDYGLETATLIYSINEGKESSIAMGALPRPENQQDLPYPRFGVWPMVWEIKQDIPDLRTGDVISYVIEVIDIRGEEAGAKERSEPRICNIVSYSEYHSYIFSKLTGTKQELATGLIEAQRSRQALKALEKHVARPVPE